MANIKKFDELNESTRPDGIVDSIWIHKVYNPIIYGSGDKIGSVETHFNKVWTIFHRNGYNGYKLVDDELVKIDKKPSTHYSKIHLLPTIYYLNDVEYQKILPLVQNVKSINDKRMESIQLTRDLIASTVMEDAGNIK